ncbi:MAG: glutathione S-transferase family protein [Myxococcota bacterium]
MLIVHHLEHSRSFRILWLLEELGTPYDIVEYQRDPKTMLAPPTLRRIHPLGKAPVIQDGDRTVAETGAIVEYLLDAVPDHSLRPALGSPAFESFRYWLHYAEASAMPPMLLKLVLDRIDEKTPFIVRPIAATMTGLVKSTFLNEQIALHSDHMEAHADPWFLGDQFSAVDVVMSFPVQAFFARGGLRPDTHPKLHRYLRACEGRDAFQRALERGGPLRL